MTAMLRADAWRESANQGPPTLQAESRRYRTVFISDVHLGTRGCQSRLLLDFLREVDWLDERIEEERLATSLDCEAGVTIVGEFHGGHT